ncbi:Mini-chromosome maintenance complex-binding protein [Nymphon striatum]|nr:Mini-chromosome maintenance complex-binding protein [Nymphon striatum]
MPGIDDWIGNPLSVADSLFVQNNHNPCHEKVANYFNSRISDSTLAMIPSLNEVPHHTLKPNSLVRFRCMIQDMYDREFYMAKYQVKDRQMGPTSFLSGSYRDVADSVVGEILMDSPENVPLDRMTFYCVSVPAENDWVNQISFNVEVLEFRNAYKHCTKKSFDFKQPSTSSTPVREKRQHEEDNDMDCNDSKVTENSTNQTSNSDIGASNVNSENDSKRSSVSSLLPKLNFPLPNASNVIACLVKLYDDVGKYSVNEIVEFVGILSVDPALAHVSFQNSRSDSEMDEEDKARCPPPSLVPRLHVIATILETPSVPSIQSSIVRKETAFVKVLSTKVTQEVSSSANSIRTELHSILKQALLGDELAADYMICHLLSSVYVRKETMALGKFALNLSKITSAEFSSKLYNLLQEIIPKSHFLQMSLSNMNEQIFVPKKDYSSNRLVSGLLQLSSNTHLVVDELALTAGQLDSKGVQNVTALGSLIMWQKVEYDFNFHKMDYSCDIPVLIISEGKSMLPSDFHVPVTQQISWPEMESIYRGIHAYLTPALLESIRKYLIILKNTEFNVPEELQTTIQNDFVNMRSQNNQMKAEDLHSLLVIARLLSLSFGQSVLTIESWEKAKAMETERKLRLS